MRTPPKAVVNGVLVLVLAAVGGGTWWALRPDGAAASDPEGTTARIATVTRETITATIAAQGTLTSAKVADRAFTVAGTVAAVEVGVGDTVKKGDVLATLSPDDVDDALRAAQRTHTAAQAKVNAAALDRDSAQQAVDEALDALDDTTTEIDPKTGEKTTTTRGSKSQVTAAKARLVSAKAQVTQAVGDRDEAADAVTDAEADAKKTTLKATFAGVVTAVGLSVGDVVGSTSSASSGGSSGVGSAEGVATASASSAAITVQKTDTLAVSASFAEADAALLAVDQAATVTFPAVDGASAAATVSAIDPVGTTSGSVVVFGATITLDEAPEGVRLGQTATITVTTQSVEDALALPSNAVTATSGTAGTVQLVADDGTRSSVDVVIGVQGDTTTEIVSGLDEGDTVLVSLDTAVGSTSSDQQSTNGFPGGGEFPAGGSFPGGSMPALPGGRG